MQNTRQNPWQKPISALVRRNAGIWLAWTAALGFHVMILCLPLSGEKPPDENVSASIELQLTSHPTGQVPQASGQTPETPPQELLPEERLSEVPVPEPVHSLVDEQPQITAEKTGAALLTPNPLASDTRRDLDNMGELESRQLTNAVLMRQFITEESDAERIFGRQIERGDSEGQKDFHYPVRQNMLSMLDRPMQDIPFAYQEGLIHFAYDPGVKGDLQRFWDVITPEFGWRTKYGTEVKCKLILVIAGCAWK